MADLSSFNCLMCGKPMSNADPQPQRGICVACAKKGNRKRNQDASHAKNSKLGPGKNVRSCPDCGESVHPRLTSCPSCRFVFDRQSQPVPLLPPATDAPEREPSTVGRVLWMMLLISLVLMGLFILFFVACLSVALRGPFH